MRIHFVPIAVKESLDIVHRLGLNCYGRRLVPQQTGRFCV